MPRNQLAYVSDALFARALTFCERHPGIVSQAQMLQKLAIFDFVVPALPSTKEVRLLEIGSGLGIHSALLSHHCRVSSTELEVPGSFVGADHHVKKVRDLVFGELGADPVDFRYHNGARLPFDDGSFDVVFHNSVIEHVPDIEAFNAEVHRVLKPGGLCLCITGTPALCRFRLTKHYAKLPFTIATALAKELIPPALLNAAVRPLAKAMGLSASTSRKIVERLTRADRRLVQVAPEAAQPGAVCQADIGKMYARLFHFVYFPDYNRIVVEKSAREHGTSADALLRSAWLHFQRPLNRLAFELAPATHGQHYRDVWDEMEQWRVDRWRNVFISSRFTVDSIQGYRYHHRLEITPSAKLNSLLYLRAVKQIHRDIAQGKADPSRASEFLLVARSARRAESAA